jgi:hypothetical protein
MAPKDQKFVRSVLTGTHWPLTIINGIAALGWLVVGLLRYNAGTAIARDAGISVWDAIGNPYAVAEATNVHSAVMASMRLSEAMLTFLIALIFLMTPVIHLVFYRQLRRIFRELPPSGDTALQSVQ